MPDMQPLVLSCHGGSDTAAIADATAAELTALGAAEATDDLARVHAELASGRRVLALDGCRGACCTRLLEADGVEPDWSLTLDDLAAGADPLDPAALAERAVSQLLEPVGATARAHRRVAAPVQRAPEDGRRHGVEDYLLAIDALASQVVDCGALAVESPVLAAHVSYLLGVSRPSAGEMLARLEQRGLLRRSARKELLLTEAGRLAADRAVRAHRLLERFAVDLLGYPAAEAFRHARSLAEAFDDDAIDRLSAALGRPDRCPHGWPVDAAEARRESRELSALGWLSPGEDGVVVSVSERDEDAVETLAAAGIGPGIAIRVVRAGPEGALRVAVSGSESLLAADAAAAAFVRRAAP